MLTASAGYEKITIRELIMEKLIMKLFWIAAIFSGISFAESLTNRDIANAPIQSTDNRTPATPFPFQPTRFTPPICFQPQIRGDCRALLRRYFYDVSIRACREFFYGGCGGNENNFASKSECETTCSVTGFNSGPAVETASATAANTTPVLALSEKIGRCPISMALFGNVSQDENVTVSCVESTCDQDSQCLDEKKCCYVDGCGRSMCVAPMIGGIDDVKSLPVSGPAASSICRKPLESGPCRAYFPRWGFDGKACVEFVYGGCQGNENNFETKNDCEQKCSVSKSTIACPMVKMVPPPGCEVVPDAKIENGCPMPEIRCSEGACANNPCPNACDNCVNEPKQCLTTPCPQYRCERKDDCSVQKIVVPLQQQQASRSIISTSAVSSTISPCALVLCAPETICREVRGSATCVQDPLAVSLSKASSRAKIVCQTQADVGRCRASMERWFFNLQTNRCERFTYGGCGGNENNFESRQSCESYCSAFIISNNNDDKSGECPKIDNSAIGICVNECESDADCPAADAKCCSNGCGRTCTATATATATTNLIAVTDSALTAARRLVAPNGPPSLDTQRRCRQSAEVGLCKGAFPRWYFNPFTATCESFIYGGCGGNGNNFETAQQCQQICGQVAPCPQYSPPMPVPGCSLVSWIGVDGCPTLNFKCTEGECARQNCPGKCDFCINEPKQCVSAPCQQYRCQTNETCLYEQCSTMRCGFNTTCKVVNGVVGCYADSPKVLQCGQPKDPGPCLAYVLQYFYNAVANNCEQFVYGGCNGNSNRFTSLDECRRTCASSTG